MEHQLTPPRKKRHGLIVIAALLIVGVAVAGWLKWGGSDNDRSHSSEIADIVPSDADTFLVAPFSDSWWGQVTAFDDPGKGLDRIDPASAPAPISTIGYSRSADHVQREAPMAGPLRVLYVETADEADAAKVADWLQESSEGSGYIVSQHGPVLTLTASWVPEYEKPKSPLATAPGYTSSVTEKSAAMWMNPSKETASLATEVTAGPYSKVLESAFGYEANTTWIGTSTDGASWSGAFATGGIDKSKLDLKSADATLRATEKIIFTIEGPTAKSQVIEPGLGGILGSALFTQGVDQLGNKIFAGKHSTVQDPLVTVSSDVTDWDAALRGVQGTRENIGTRTISANATDMVVTFDNTPKK